MVSVHTLPRVYSSIYVPALNGMFHFWFMWPVQLENGTPLSRAKAHSSRAQVARAVMFPAKISRKSRTFRTTERAGELVLLKRTR